MKPETMIQTIEEFAEEYNAAITRTSQLAIDRSTDNFICGIEEHPAIRQSYEAMYRRLKSK